MAELAPVATRVQSSSDSASLHPGAPELYPEAEPPMIRIPRKRWVTALVIILAVGGVTAWYFTPAAASEDSAVIARVKKGEFKVIVTTAGELRAHKFVQIQGPLNMQQARGLPDEDRVARARGDGREGGRRGRRARSVRHRREAGRGDARAAEGRSAASRRRSSTPRSTSPRRARRSARMELALEEKKLAKEQAQYEAPTRQAPGGDRLREGAARARAGQARTTTRRRSRRSAKMREVGADFERQQNKLKIVQEVMAGFTIKAPAPGMVIYVKEWNGKKKGVGSQVNAVGPDRRDAARPHADGVDHLRQRDRRPEDRRRPEGDDLARLRPDQEARRARSTAVANVGEQRPNRTPRCSR